MKRQFFLFIPILAVFMGCVGQPDEQADFVYPLSTGDRWYYARTQTFSNFDPVTFNIPFPNPLRSNIVVINEGLRAIRDSINTIRIKAKETNLYGTFIGINYYQNKPDGLYNYAYNTYSGGTLILPKNLTNVKILFKGKLFNHINELTHFLFHSPQLQKPMEDSLIYEIPPLIVIKYPLQIGTHWNYRSFPEYFIIDKEIVDTEEITTEAGKFFCYIIQWLYDMDQDYIWDDDITIFDYIASIGLVRRQIIIKNIYYTDEWGNTMGTVDMSDDYVLTTTSLRRIQIESNLMAPQYYE